MSIDPIAIEVSQYEFDNGKEDEELITHCDTIYAWTEWRNKLTDEISTNWQSSNN